MSTMVIWAAVAAAAVDVGYRQLPEGGVEYTANDRVFTVSKLGRF